MSCASPSSRRSRPMVTWTVLVNRSGVFIPCPRQQVLGAEDVLPHSCDRHQPRLCSGNRTGCSCRNQSRSTGRPRVLRRCSGGARPARGQHAHPGRAQLLRDGRQLTGPPSRMPRSVGRAPADPPLQLQHRAPRQLPRMRCWRDRCVTPRTRLLRGRLPGRDRGVLAGLVSHAGLGARPGLASRWGRARADRLSAGPRWSDSSPA
jgi:hypothetical protein